MRELPVFKVLGHAVVKPLANLRVTLLLSFPVLLVSYFAINLLANMIDPRHSYSGDSAPIVVLFSILIYVAFIYLLGNWAVNWHRFVLLNEEPKMANAFTSNGPNWRYIGNAVLISIVLGLMQIPLKVISYGFERSGTSIGGIFAMAFSLIAMWWSFRLTAKLPAVALGHSHYGMWDSWEATKGNFWRFMGLCLVAIFVFGIAMIVSFLPFSNLVDRPAMLARVHIGAGYFVLPIICFWFSCAFGISILTALYGYFGEGRDFNGIDLAPLKPKKVDDWKWSKKLTPMSAPVEDIADIRVVVEKPVKPKPKKPAKKTVKKIAKKSK